MISDPTPADARPTGTETVISGVKQSADLLLGEFVADELAKLFAAYLSQYPEVAIVYDASAIDPLPLQECQKHFTLDDIELTGGRKATATVSIIEWRLPTPRAIHLCDANGVALHETEAGVQIPAPGFHFTAYLKSDLFRDLDKENQLILADLHPDVDAILKRAKGTIKGYFRKRLAERQSAIVERWKKEDIYPYLDAIAANSVEEVERQVFDILAVNVETYLPAFEGADSRSRKFMFRLLAQALRQNPASVQQIITEVLSLKEDEQKDLAELLEKIDSKVLSQIESYAIAVAAEARFRGQNTRWTFMAVSNEMDEHAERKARQRGRPKGLVFDDSEHNITVWAKTWSEVILHGHGRDLKQAMMKEHLTGRTRLA